jgi:uncharacterized protein (DUF2236 family)
MFGQGGAVAEAARLREMHVACTGTGFDGHRYSALDREAYAWVHLANADSLLEFFNRFGRPLPNAEQERFYAECRQIGLVLVIRADDMATDWVGLQAHVDTMIATRLDVNPTALQFLETLSLRGMPAPPYLPAPLWPPLRMAGRSVLHDITVGMLPPALRDKLGLDWPPTRQRGLDLLAAAIPTAAAATPAKLLHSPAAAGAGQVR